MKEREDIDWRLFELFENDLSEAEEAKILAEIENNDALEEDWKLLQQTKLVAPEISYANKKTLLKKDTRVLAFTNLTWLKYAAAVIIVVAAYPIWKGYFAKEDINHIATSAGEVIENIDPKATEGIEESTPIVIEESVPVRTQEIVRITEQDVRKEKRSIHKIIPLDTSNALPLNQPQLGIRPTEVLVSVGAKERYTIKSESNVLPNLNIRSVDYASLYQLEDEQKPLVKKYKGIRPAVNGGLAWLSSPFKNSKIKIKPVKDKRGALRIVFTSKQYYATAMVSLKPIKE